MPITTPRVKEHQTRWNEIVRDPSLRDLPYKVETNSRGKIVLGPHRNRHSFLQETIQDLLDEHAPEGSVPPEFAIVTSEGVKVPDVVWMSPGRRREMAETGDPTTLAPEVCVEITSSSNTAEEIQEKRALYLDVGAEEVWVVDEEEHIRIYDHEGEREGSAIASTVPSPL